MINNFWLFISIGFVLMVVTLLEKLLQLQDFNKYAGAGIQFLGGCLILYSINENYKTVTGKSVFQELILLFKEKDQNIVMVAKPMRGKSKMVSTCHKTGGTTEAKVDNLIATVVAVEQSLREEIEDQRKDFVAALSEVAKELKKNREEAASMRRKIAGITIDGWRMQVFSAFLVFYGAILGVA